MNRRDAMKALMGLPALSAISVAQVSQGDVIVLETDSYMSQSHKAECGHKLKEIWPGCRAIVLDGGMKLKVVKGASV